MQAENKRLAAAARFGPSRVPVAIRAKPNARLFSGIA
jgi:hypothetical protein